jgi:hypothetical protein
MPDSVYRVTEVIGVSKESWEAAAQTAVKTAANTVRDLRVAEVGAAGRRDRERAGDRFPGAAGDLVQVRVGRLATSGPRVYRAARDVGITPDQWCP